MKKFVNISNSNALIVILTFQIKYLQRLFILHVGYSIFIILAFVKNFSKYSNTTDSKVTKVLQYFGHVRHNSAYLDDFVKVVKVTNNTKLRCQACLRVSEY